jgi:membrane fusion protein, multidrug efflux system
LANSDTRLRAGMSVRAYILSYASSNSLAVPRTAVQWDNETATCEVVRGARKSRRELQLGMANEQYFEVLKGLDPGERVVSR